MFQKKILVAIDNSESSSHVFDVAVSLAKPLNASLMLLHVLSPNDPGYPEMPLYGVEAIYTTDINTYRKQWEVFEQSGLALLKSLEAQATEMGIGTEFSQMAGDPGRAICKLADTWQADTIVLGRRGHSGLSELFLGSVSNYVMHHAPCSVLVVHGKAETKTNVA